MYKLILIPTDGSDFAQKGVNHGLNLAKSVGAKVTIVTVSEPFPIYAGAAASAGWTTPPMETGEYEVSQRQAAENTLADARAAADRLGVDAETVHIPQALPAEAIVEIANNRHCSLIVMASHGGRGLRRFLLGSQTSEVLSRSSVPVLVVT
ncbi:universal stress protein [Nocardioides sp. NPDC004968]|uniref:universal stress protein n=1 Tax=Nocardioides sp. NPDC004968 TaxID=3155894 RepID=UPI0033BAA4F3